MSVLQTCDATRRLGEPDTAVERGTIEGTALSYARYWSWQCGCRGEIIAGTLIELQACALHACAA